MKPAPRLNCQLFLEEAVRADDGAGGFDVTWTILGLVWAEIRHRRGRELSSNGQPLSRLPQDVILRAAPIGNTARPIAGQRFRHGSRIFNINAVTEWDIDARYLCCQTEEEVAT